MGRSRPEPVMPVTEAAFEERAVAGRPPASRLAGL